MTIDLTDVSQIETILEESAKGVFVAAGYTALTRANAAQNLQQPTPRVEIKSAVGAVTGLKCIRASDNTTQFSAWRFQYAIQTVVASVNDGLNMTPIQYVSAVRKIMNLLAQKSWGDTTNFPNLIIAEPLRDSGTNINTKQGDGFEYAAIGYSGIAMIRSGAAW